MTRSNSLGSKDLSTYKIRSSPAGPVPAEINPRRTKLSLVITWCLWALYTVIQVLLAFSIQKASGCLLWRIWVVLLAEFCLSFQEVVCHVNIMLALFGVPCQQSRPSLELTGDSAPTVTVLITCCGESNEVILTTAKAAAAQDYASGRYNVFILDDGHDKRLQKEVELLDKQSNKRGWARVTYLSRSIQSGTKSYFKAGNLQFGIDETRKYGDSEIIAGLDADMIPQRCWLRKMVPHLLMDEKTALAIPPQDYYNIPSGDPLGQRADFTMYFTVQEALNDRLDAAMCTGTGYVVKRQALDSIGGWPLAECGEDFMCSSLLSDAGWKAALVRENLQSGLAPDSLRGLIKQRMRWTDAGIEVHQHFGFYLPGSRVSSQMTSGQRVVAWLYVLRDYAPLTNVLALILLPIALFPTPSDDFALIASDPRLMLLICWLRFIFLLFFVAQKINLYILYNHVGLSRVLNFQSNEIWAAPYMVFRCIASLLPSRFNPATFAVCGTVTSTANERSQHHRRKFPWRLLSPDMAMYALYIIYALTPLVLRIQSHLVSTSTAMLFPFPGVLVKLLRSISNVTVPLRYMIWPPSVPQGTRLLEEDDEGVKRPTGKWDTNGSGNEAWWVGTILCELVLIWICGR